MTAYVIRGNALVLPLADASVDLICTSPPYFGLRSYQDDGQHYEGQIGSEPTPAEFVDALIAATREMVRVLKPTGSIFVELGDSYTEKSLNLSPHRYAIGCTDRLGLYLRAEIIWSRPNGLPESVTDRVRRSHSVWFHFTREPRYFSAVDEIREEHAPSSISRAAYGVVDTHGPNRSRYDRDGEHNRVDRAPNPLGKLPGSVWTIPTQPLTVPPELGVDHFACVDTETEILTSTGWLRWDQVKVGDLAASHDLQTGRSRWTHVQAVNHYDYAGEMVAVESRDLSMRLTPNHRAIVQRSRGRSKQKGPVEVVEARFLDRYHFVPRSAPWEHTTDDSVGTGWASILGWIAAEGWYQGRCVYLSQSATANPDKVKQIDALLPDATWRRERQREWRGTPWLDVEWRLSDYDAVAVQAAMPDKLLPTSLITATTSERWAVLNAFIAGDGHIRPEDDRISIFQKRRENLDVLQAIAVTLGYKTSLQFSGGRWVLYLTHGGRSTTLRTTGGMGSKVTRESYEGIVWCPTTGTGTFIARRRGIPFITGNSFPMEFPRRIIRGWSPAGVCTACGEGRRPVADVKLQGGSPFAGRDYRRLANGAETGGPERPMPGGANLVTITGYACGCPEPTAPTRPAVILDPFSGTGTTVLVAKMLGRTGIGVDMSSDYCRLAAWRTTNPGQMAAALQVEKPEPVSEGQPTLFEEVHA